jgi:hypothetical protein
MPGAIARSSQLFERQRRWGLSGPPRAAWPGPGLPLPAIVIAVADLDDGLRDRLRAAGVDPSALSGPGLGRVIDRISVPGIDDERACLPPLEAAGLILRLRETGHRFLWPRPAQPR